MTVVTSEASLIRQSKTKIYTARKSGTRALTVISGSRWARVGSIPSTRSTMVVLYCPEGVSRMAPIGTRDSLDSRDLRRSRRV